MSLEKIYPLLLLIEIMQFFKDSMLIIPKLKRNYIILASYYSFLCFRYNKYSENVEKIHVSKLDEYEKQEYNLAKLYKENVLHGDGSMLYKNSNFIY